MALDRGDNIEAQIVALRLIVQGLFAKWAMEAEDPPQSAERMIEGIIGSMHAVTDDPDEHTLLMLDRIEDHLRFILANVQVRLSR